MSRAYGSLLGVWRLVSDLAFATLHSLRTACKDAVLDEASTVELLESRLPGFPILTEDCTNFSESVLKAPKS